MSDTTEKKLTMEEQIDALFPATWDDRGVRMDNPNHTIQRNAAKRFYEKVMVLEMEENSKRIEAYKEDLKAALAAIGSSMEALIAADEMGIELIKKIKEGENMYEILQRVKHYLMGPHPTGHNVGEIIEAINKLKRPE